MSSPHTLPPIDYPALFQAGHELVQQSALDDLLSTLMRVILPLSQAEHAAVFLPHQTHWFRAADADGAGINVMLPADEWLLESRWRTPTQFPDDTDILSAILSRVLSAEREIFWQASSADTPYLQTHQPNSVFCLPLHYNARLLGLLYLDTRSEGQTVRPEPVRLLSSQIGAALAHALLRARGQTLTDELHQEIAEHEWTEQQLQQEITSREEAEGKLRAQNAELDVFARTVAHDLKTPLHTIIGLTELVKYEADDRLLPDLQQVIQTAYRMNSIISALLLLARIRDATVIVTPMFMEDVIARTLKRLRQMVVEHQGNIILPDEWPLISGYAPWIEEIWVNYISNALKYGGKPPQIELGFTQIDDAHYQFWVQDNGPGLSEAQQALLFQQFSQIHPHKTDGYGLGLSIVKRIVTKLGGEAGVSSRIGQGSRFYFTLEAVDDPH